MNGGTIINNKAKVNGGGIDFDSGWFEYNSGRIENNTTDNNDDNSNTFPPISKYKDWTKDESLNLKTITAKLLKSYTKGTQVENCASQGMAIGKDYIVWAQVNSTNENPYIYIANKSFEIKKVHNNYNFGHANAMTYNVKEDRYLVTYTSQDKCYISSFKIDSDYNIYSVQTKELSKYYLGFAYIGDKNEDYYVGVYRNQIHIMDAGFNVIDTSNMLGTDLTKQDIAYYDNHIYFACYESGHITQYQSNYFNSKEKHSNLIYVYDLDGNLEKTLYIPYTLINGEIEGLHIDNDILTFGYNRSDKISFYQNTSDIQNPKLSVTYSTQELTNENVVVTISSNEEIQDIEGWNKSADGKALTKEYANNVEETIIVKDIAENESIATIKIENITNKVAGDLNDNGQLDFGDVIKIYRHIAQGNNVEVATKHPEWKLSDEKIIQGDLNKNGQVDMGDTIKIQRYIAAKNNPEVAQKHPEWLNIQ